ncbi:XTP/dITP diphosphatase [Pontiella sulfatireligans]|uniref:dITP/XTP pyrophosphatase n=1 Tax=Pontiella sulfatireligans TaxID=2750658 RepID=A0A6C2UTM8_9BACT|nr:XTP/dITP diphosphatase [Pontiella sulfatireligans]VGO22641.1 Non-canonical purine NTP pyrophosphatase [Pontiella sulfatireligans]
MKLVIATRNAHKLEEIKAIFNFKSLEVLSAFDFPDIPDVIEDGGTLEVNAEKKAVEIALATGCWALADDSGLEVNSLDGAPGVYSARYAGEECSYAANNEKLLRELAETTDRSARFRTVIALSDPKGNVRTLEGICPGMIINKLRGTNGFGYDPLFVPNGHSETFAELSNEVKNSISHRARALQKAQVEWAELLSRL